MMTMLLESAGARGPKRTGWTMASVSLHGALIAGAVILTTRAPAVVDEPAAVIPIVPFVPAQPREPVPSQPVPAPVPGAPLIPAVPIPLPTVPKFEVDRPFSRSLRPADVFGRPIVPVTSGGQATEGIHTSGSVERIARPLPANGSPEYPRSLRVAGAEGSVVVTFVVDTAGRAEPSSITIVSATHPLFADAVRQWLRGTRYAPAEIDGRRVRQLVQQEVGFRTER